MIESKYNHYFRMDDGARLAFNAMSCGLALTDERYYELLSVLKGINCESDVPCNLKETYEAARAGHFIVDNECDELGEYLTIRHKLMSQRKNLGLTIAPTLDCNFKCIYCYENRREGVMDQATMNGIVRFVSRQATVIKNLRVIWYGGEPLLAPSIVSNLSKCLLEVCSRNEITYESFIITNGSLIDAGIVKMLVDSKVKGAQITLDGPRDIHDKRRVLRNGGSSFDTILNGIQLLVTAGINVNIRVNVDKSNDDRTEELVSDLAQKIDLHKVRIGLGRVVKYSAACKVAESECFSNKAFALRQIVFNTMLKRHGFDERILFPFPKPKPLFCSAERENSFVIDPYGFLYKCWNTIGNPDYAIGNVGDTVDWQSKGMCQEWLARDFRKESKCGSCKFLPICAGGCPYMAIVADANRCDGVRYNLDALVQEYYKKFLREGSASPNKE